MTNSDVDKPAAANRALSFEMSLFPEVAGAATTHFLTVMDREMAKKIAEVQNSDSSNDDQAKLIEQYQNLYTAHFHYLIREHSARIVGGLTRMMFPEVYPGVLEDRLNEAKVRVASLEEQVAKIKDESTSTSAPEAKEIDLQPVSGA